MKRLKIILCIAVAGVLACVGWWCWPWRINPSPPPPAKAAPPAQQVPAEERSEKAVEETAAAVTAKNSVSAESLKAWLEMKGHSPEAIAAALDVTQSLELLRRGLEKWPDSPLLLTRLMLMKAEYSPDAVRAAETLQLVQPDSSLAVYFLARDAMARIKFEDAAALLEAALKLKPPAIESAAEVLVRREALEAAGATPNAAKVNAMLSPTNLAGAEALGDLLHSIEGTLDPFVSMSNEVRNRLKRAGVAVTEHVRMDPQRSLLLEILAVKAQSVLLGQFAPDYEFGATGQTVGTRLEQLMLHQEKIAAAANSLKKRLRTMSPEELASHFDDVLARGEVGVLIGSPP